MTKFRTERESGRGREKEGARDTNYNFTQLEPAVFSGHVHQKAPCVQHIQGPTVPPRSAAPNSLKQIRGSPAVPLAFSLESKLRVRGWHPTHICCCYEGRRCVSNTETGVPCSVDTVCLRATHGSLIATGIWQLIWRRQRRRHPAATGYALGY